MTWTRRSAIIAGMSAASLPGMANAQSRLFRQVPKSGERIPIVGLGTWQAFDIAPGHSDWAEARRAVDLFLKQGGRVIDSSPMYGAAEEAIGTITSSLGDAPRPFLATKVWTSGRSEGEAQIERSFRLLKTRRMDLLQIHNLLDYRTHLATLRGLKERGRIRHIGATHYHSGAYAELERAIASGALDFVQFNYSVGEREAERRLLRVARDNRVGVIVNRPFAGGQLFSAIRRKPLPAWAGELRCASWAQLLLKYVLADSAVTCAIPGTRNPRYVLDNLGAATAPLPDEPMRRRIVAAALD